MLIATNDILCLGSDCTLEIPVVGKVLFDDGYFFSWLDEDCPTRKKLEECLNIFFR